MTDWNPTASQISGLDLINCAVKARVAHESEKGGLWRMSAASLIGVVAYLFIFISLF